MYPSSDHDHHLAAGRHDEVKKQSPRGRAGRMSMPPGKAASLVRPAGGRQAWSAEAPASTSTSAASSSSQAFDSPRQDFGSPFSPPQRQLDSFQEDQPLAKIPLSIASVVEEGDEEEEEDEADGAGGAGGAASGGGRGEQKIEAPRGVKGRGSTGKSTSPAGRRSAGSRGEGRGSNDNGPI